MPESERTEFVRRTAGSDTEVRSEVLSLLEEYEASEEIEPVVATLPPDASIPTWIGQSVGAYTLTREIGEGGMSRVFLAERADDEYETQVAVKLLREGLLSETLLGRFRRERQILANLDHPNIARLIDGGTTDFGVAYLVMEYVDGPPLTTYCSERTVSIDERLDLFLSTCDAVRYAHRNLVLHLDLKPGNILVGRDGTPKLLDFGIARLLEGGWDAAGDPTVGGLRPMTPRYASPEQLRGASTSTASDVYSLGVILYELLTGRVPFEMERLMHRAAFKSGDSRDATRPSALVRRRQEPVEEGKTAREFAADMRLTRAQLSRRLSGDLDRIVIKALRPDPEERYASVEALANDVRRHREGLPVEAVGDSWLYRSRKFVRRHRWAVALATTLGSLVLLSTFLLAVSNQRIERQRAQVQEERDNAVQLSTFLVDVFKLADPRSNPESAATVADVLELGAKNAVLDLPDQPEAQTAVLQTIGDVELSHGRFEEAARNFVSALEIHERTHPDDEVRTADLLSRLGEAKTGTGELDLAEQYERRALDIRLRLLGPETLEVAESLDHLGELRRWNGDFITAERHFDRALAIRRSELGDRHPAVAESLQSSANLQRLLGQYRAADAKYSEALEILRAARGESHPDTVEAMTSLAVIRLHRGEHEAAEQLQRRVVEILEGQYGKRHPLVASTINRLARTLEIQGRLEEAEATYREALSLRMELLGDRHFVSAITMSALATLLDRIGESKESERLYETSLSISDEHFPNGTFGTSYPLIGLGCHRFERGEYEVALRFFEDALEIREKSFPADHPKVAEAQLLVERARETLAIGRPRNYVDPAPAGPEIAESTSRTVCRSI